MARLSQSGSVLCGVAGVPASIDQVTVGHGAIGPNAWIDRVASILQACSPSGCRLIDQSGTELRAAGANFLAAGGGRWASFVNDAIHDSHGHVTGNRYPLAMSDDGELATFIYQQGDTIEVTDADGALLLSLPVTIMDARGAFYRAGVLSFRQAGIDWRLINPRTQTDVPFKRRQDGVSQCVPLSVDGVLHVVEHDYEGAITIRPADSWLAFIVAAGPASDRFAIDARQLSNGQVCIVWNTTEAEQIGTLETRTFPAFGMPMYQMLNTESRVVPVAPAEPLPDLTIPTQRPAWIVDTEAILAKRGNGISTSDGPGPKLFEDALWVTPTMEPLLEGIYWGPEPPRNNVSREEAFIRCRDMALRNRVPVFVCDEWGDGPTAEWMARFAAVGCRAIWLCELYRDPSESRDDFRARTRARLATISGAQQ